LDLDHLAHRCQPQKESCVRMRWNVK
jgi:hypothetical protein